MCLRGCAFRELTCRTEQRTRDGGFFRSHGSRSPNEQQMELVDGGSGMADGVGRMWRLEKHRDEETRRRRSTESEPEEMPPKPKMRMKNIGSKFPVLKWLLPSFSME
ncbi:uncharacterized protein Hap1MRO34_020251 isoform 1-T1 [Clarias gariepinus]